MSDDGEHTCRGCVVAQVFEYTDGQQKIDKENLKVVTGFQNELFEAFEEFVEDFAEEHLDVIEKVSGHIEKGDWIGGKVVILDMLFMYSQKLMYDSRCELQELKVEMGEDMDEETEEEAEDASGEI